MFGVDGYWNAYSYGYPSGAFQFAGFDRMKNGETKTLRLTMHRPVPWQIGFSITSEEVHDERPWVLEP